MFKMNYCCIHYLMIHDHALMIHFEKQDQLVHIQMCTPIVACYMFRPTIVAILREVLFEGYIA